jgi:hypothetical protein
MKNRGLPAFIISVLFFLVINKTFAQELSSMDSIYVSPKKAFILSALLPGSGQIYNKKYFKAVLFVGVESYYIMKFYQKYELVSNNPNNQREKVKRNKYAWWITFWYAMNILDAYVDAHLANFPEEPVVQVFSYQSGVGFKVSF